MGSEKLLLFRLSPDLGIVSQQIHLLHRALPGASPRFPVFGIFEKLLSLGKYAASILLPFAGLAASDGRIREFCSGIFLSYNLRSLHPASVVLSTHAENGR